MITFPLKYKNEIISGYVMDANNNVYSLYTDRMMERHIHENNKMVYINYTKNNVKRETRLDYLVISTFGEFHDDTIRVMHIDGDLNNCKFENLIQVRKIDIINKYKDLYEVDSLEDIHEVWKIYPKAPELEVSNFGNVRYTVSKTPFKVYPSHGYMLVFIHNTHFHVHQMVAELFVENSNPKEFIYVNHLDANKANNRFYNLEWCNNQMNGEHSFLSGCIRQYGDDTIHAVCKLLQDGIPHTVISTITGVDRKYISEVYTGRKQHKISKNYTFQRRIPNSEKYNKDKIISLMKNGVKPKEIASILNVEYNQSFISYYERLRRLERGLPK